MSFLAPLFLVGLAGLAIPVLVHLTRHERGKPLAFPSLMFLERIPFRETSRRRLRHIALLLIRLAALALVVLAFARPFAQGGRLATVGGPGPEELVVLLDRSYSMELNDHWAQGVSMARSAVAALGPSDRVSLIVFDETPHLLHRSATEPRRVLESLDTLTTSSLATRTAPAVKLAASVLAASELPRRRVVIVSDFQRTGWRPDRDAVLPEGTTVETLAVGDADAGAANLADARTANLALAGLELRRESAGGRERVSARARLAATDDPGTGNPGQGAGTQVQETPVEVTLVVDDTEVGRASVVVPASGSIPVAFDPFTLTGPFTRGELRISDEALQADNTLHFVLSAGGNLDVLVVDPLGEGESNLHLRGALGIAEGAGFAARVVRSTPSEDMLADHDVVVLNGSPFPGGEAGTRLRDFVEGGGGLFVVLGERTRVPAIHAEFLPANVGGTTDAGGEELRLGFVDYDHAVFEAFRGARAGDFSRATFFRARRLEVTGGRVLARFDDGSPALVEGRRGEGRVLVWATGLDRFWNDLALHPVYLPFVHRTARYLGGRGELPAWHPAGATVNLAELAEEAGSMEMPDGAVAMEPDGGFVLLDPTTPLLTLDAQGIWEIRPPGQRPDHPMALAVNVDLAESDLSRLDLEEFTGAIGGGLAALQGEAATDSGSTTPTTDAASVSQDIQPMELEKRQSFWRHLMAAAFLLIAAETLLANRLSRFREGRRLAR